MANDGISEFIVINRFPLVKAAMNAPRVCKLHKNFLTVFDQCAMVVKRLNFFIFSITIFQVHNSYLNWLPNCQF